MKLGVVLATIALTVFSPASTEAAAQSYNLTLLSSSDIRQGGHVDAAWAASVQGEREFVEVRLSCSTSYGGYVESREVHEAESGIVVLPLRDEPASCRLSLLTVRVNNQWVNMIRQATLTFNVD